MRYRALALCLVILTACSSDGMRERSAACAPGHSLEECRSHQPRRKNVNFNVLTMETTFVTSDNSIDFTLTHVIFYDPARHDAVVERLERAAGAKTQIGIPPVPQAIYVDDGSAEHRYLATDEGQWVFEDEGRLVFDSKVRRSIDFDYWLRLPAPKAEAVWRDVTDYLLSLD